MFLLPTARRGKRNEWFLPRTSALFGSNDVEHDYRRDPDDDGSDPMGEEDIEAVNLLLFERAKCRKIGDQREAEDLRFVLREVYGVHVDDQQKTWSKQKASQSPDVEDFVDTEEWGLPENEDEQLGEEDDLFTWEDSGELITKPSSPENKDRGRKKKGDVGTNKPISNINSEAQKKKKKEKRKKDESSISKEKRQGELSTGNEGDGGYDEQTYELDEQFAPLIRSKHHDSYRKAHGSLPLPPEDEDYVARRMERIIQAERDKDYETSHAVRTELYMCYDVFIDDTLGLWSVGGDFRMNSHNMNNENDPTDGLVPDNVEDESRNKVLEKLTVLQLKQKLREAGLPVSGRKGDLIERLKDAGLTS